MDLKAALSSGSVPFEIHPSRIHGNGAFSLRPFLRGDRIVAYLGERISKPESLKRCKAGNPFVFYLDAEQDIDGSVDWNPARFLNHSCDPNCDAVLLEDAIWLVARRHIVAGEELTFDYGYDLLDWRSFPCHCGASRCLGYIVSEAHRESLKRLIDAMNARPASQL